MRELPSLLMCGSSMNRVVVVEVCAAVGFGVVGVVEVVAKIN